SHDHLSTAAGPDEDGRGHFTDDVASRIAPRRGAQPLHWRLGMVTETQELLVFQAVAKHASYARAAEELDLSPSGVSKIVSRIEERLGARLLHRTTRKLSLTEAGAAFQARTAQILADLADAEAEVQSAVARPKGTLKVTASIMFGELYLAPLLPELL